MSPPGPRHGNDAIRDIVRSYDSPVIRSYSRVRFVILRQIFLEEIGQYLPREGRILDLGCGFGLFSLYFAMLEPGRSIVGVDADARRIERARRSAARLGLTNVEYRVGDATQWEVSERFDAIYLLDLVHHLPAGSVVPFLGGLRAALSGGGTLLVKEVEDRPRWKMWFTLALDRLMVGGEPIHYWSADALSRVLRELDLDVVRHRMRDVLPYPHILYVGRAPTMADAETEP